eukprot:TRINITY_DN22653_c0_g1_i3.p1 TRINITY_DN22653_c0_g1~~TRINITY_DN22653_c0_g1_i3.p1  ORF type:complete len:543 (+),score=125.52 TRINITY_DN22653_c0_g1_i3:87-1631(+)
MPSRQSCGAAAATLLVLALVALVARHRRLRWSLMRLPAQLQGQQQQQAQRALRTSLQPGTGPTWAAAAASAPGPPAPLAPRPPAQGPPAQGPPPGRGRLAELLAEMGAVMRGRANAAGAVMVGVANAVFTRSPIFVNWWCSLQRVGAAPHAAVGAVDAEAEPLLRALGAYPVPMAPVMAEWGRAAANLASPGNAGAVWSFVQKGKPLLVLAALTQGLSMLLVDCDIVFFADPLVYVTQSLGGSDVLCQTISADLTSCCTGFIFFSASRATVAAVRHWVAIMEQVLLVDCTLRENTWCTLPEQHVWNEWVTPGLTFGGSLRPPVAALQQLPPLSPPNASRVNVSRIPQDAVGLAAAPAVRRTPGGGYAHDRSKVLQPTVALHVAGGWSPWASMNEGKQRAMAAYRAWLPKDRGGGQWGCATQKPWPPRAELVWDERCKAVANCSRCTWCPGVGAKTRHLYYAALGQVAMCDKGELAAAAPGGPDRCPLPPIDPRLVQQWRAESGGRRSRTVRRRR